MITVQALLEEIAAAFEQAPLHYGHGTDNAWDEAVRLVTFQLDLPDDRSVLMQSVSDQAQQEIRAIAQQRIATRKPLAYLLGSIPFGLILTRLAGLGDIRKVGSGNIGATNVLRTGNKLIALAVLLLDAGKGALAVLLAWQYGPDMAVFAAAGAVLGHCFPIWLKFRGGKGVATALGVLLALDFPVGAVACLTGAAAAW